MKLRLTIIAVLGSTVLLAGLAFVGPAIASDGHGVQVIEVQDRCDPASFAAAGVPCIPKPQGEITVQQLIGFISAQPEKVLRERAALGWRLHPDDTDVKVGTTLLAKNVGGEIHTFTDVTATGFVNSCVPQIAPIFAKLLPAPSAAQCAGGVGGPLVFPVGFPGNPPSTVSVPEDTPGTRLFQCLIHPWMRLTVEVKRD